MSPDAPEFLVTSFTGLLSLIGTGLIVEMALVWYRSSTARATDE